MAILGDSQTGIENLLLGLVPDVPSLTLVHPVLALESGEASRPLLVQAADGTISPFVLLFVLVPESSVLDDSLAEQGSFFRLGMDDDGRPLTWAAWIDRLAPRAGAVIAIGSRAAWSGIPAAAGSPTGAMGLEDYLGRDFCNRAGLAEGATFPLVLLGHVSFLPVSDTGEVISHRAFSTLPVHGAWCASHAVVRESPSAHSL